MSFYNRFRKKSIPEWQDYYVSYKLFKQLFKPFKQTAKIYEELFEERNQITMNQMCSLDANDVGEEIEQLKVFDQKFSSLISIEAEKIDNFYQLKYIEFQEDWSKIQENIEIFRPFRFEKSHYKKSRQLKNAFYLFYLKVSYLLEYMNLNYDALSHILRKHRKLTRNFTSYMQVSELSLEDLFDNKFISNTTEGLLQLKEEITTTFLELFYHKYNKERGIKNLKFLLKTRIISIWHSYFLFFFLGCTTIMLIFIIAMTIDGDLDPDDDETFRYIFPMFRGSAFIVIYIWFLGWNVYAWTRFHINYKKIFEFNYHFSSPTEILMRGTFFSSILLIIFVWYIVINEDFGILADGLRKLMIPKEFLPLILWVLLICYLFFPSRKYFNGEGRWYFLVRIYRFLISPCVLIDYPTGWVADQICSFVIPLQDLAYTICYYITRFRDYDDRHPQYCFANGIYVGFLVAFFPFFYRFIHFIYYLYTGRQAIKQKKREIEKIKRNEFKLDKRKRSGSHKLVSYKSADNLLDFQKNDKKTDEKSTIIQGELLILKGKELKSLLEAYHLNIMYFICIILVMLVTTFSFLYAHIPDNEVYLYCWIGFAFILSTYAYYLDIVKDWALFQPNKKHRFLREKLGYQNEIYYYLAIFFDLFLRFVWVFAISPGTSSKIMRPELFTFCMGGLEMLRRGIWNFMVVEKIYMTNLDSYKCLYEYELPYSQDEIDKFREDKEKDDEDKKEDLDIVDIQNERRNVSMFQSSGSEEEFKFRFLRTRKRGKKSENVVRKPLLEDVQEIVNTKEVKPKEEEVEIPDENPGSQSIFFFKYF